MEEWRAVITVGDRRSLTIAGREIGNNDPGTLGYKPGSGGEPEPRSTAGYNSTYCCL
jgi:hypothetical protein